MADLAGNTKDRFSCDVAHLHLIAIFAFDDVGINPAKCNSLWHIKVLVAIELWFISLRIGAQDEITDITTHTPG